MSSSRPTIFFFVPKRTHRVLEFSLPKQYCGVQNDYVLGFNLCEIFTVIALQDWVSWGIFTVIPGFPRRANGVSQHLEARPELRDWPRFELFTLKITGQGPFRNN